MMTSVNAPPQRSGSPAPKGGKFVVPPAEVEAARKWLSITRPLILADRKNKVYLWSLLMVKASQTSANDGVYVLEWKEAIQSDIPDVPPTEGRVEGSVAISDLKDIQENPHDPTCFSLIIGDSVKALKNSGGRSVLSVKCSSLGECTKYRQTLQSIWLSINKNH